MRTVLFLLFTISVFASCNVSKQIQSSAQTFLLNDPALKTAHIGISIYESATGKWWYNYQGDKYFVPASNIKIATCYAAMKYLGDSLVGLDYALQDSVVVFRGTGDPTLLHPDFKKQPVLEFLKKERRPLVIAGADFPAKRWGAGWSVSDIDASYAPERNELPVYGNVLRLYKKNDSIYSLPASLRPQVQVPALQNWQIGFERPSLSDNVFRSIQASQTFSSQEIPFITGNYMSAWMLLMDTLHKDIAGINKPASQNTAWKKVHSQPTDSLLKPLMHRSDNFFAEQALLMVSNKVLGYMSDEKLIDTILKTDFADLPHKPRWADGSGLSRYNLFTPQDLVAILGKMKTTFGKDRIQTIMATGNEGTLLNYYKTDSSFLYAKTGTLSGVVALSGYLTTVRGKDLIFSVLVNNHQSTATQVRRAVEKFLQNLRRQQ